MIKQFIKMVHPRSLLTPEPAHHHLRAPRLDPGRARAINGLGPGADAHLIEEPMAAARRRPARERGLGLDGRRHRRHDRGRRDLAGRHGLQRAACVGGDKFDESIINYIPITAC